MENRKELTQEIFNGFLKDLVEGYSLLTKVEDKIYFLETIHELIRKVFTDDDLTFDIPHFVNEKLLSKFRSKMLPFTRSFMEFYFSQAEECQRIIFKKLKITKDTPFLNADEFENMLQDFASAIRVVQKSVYVQEDPEPLILELVANSTLQNEEIETKMPGFNRTRQALMLFYLLKASGIHAGTISVATMAKFGHVLFGWSYTDIDNSELYKRLKKVHTAKGYQPSLNDLEFVKIQFELIEHHAVVELIEKEIASIHKK